MRQGQNRRMRGRNNTTSNNRKGPNPLQRGYESNGPDVKVRGNAQHIAEKYVQLARDAQSSGDRVMAENYLQHAEHYFRVVLAAQEQLTQQYGTTFQPQRFGEDGDENDEDGEEDGQTPYPFGVAQPAQSGFNPGGDGENSYGQPGNFDSQRIGQDRNGQDRNGQDRGGQERNGQERFDRNGGNQRFDRNAPNNNRNANRDRNDRDRNARPFERDQPDDQPRQDRGTQDRAVQDRERASRPERQERPERQDRPERFDRNASRGQDNRGQDNRGPDNRGPDTRPHRQEHEPQPREASEASPERNRPARPERAPRIDREDRDVSPVEALPAFLMNPVRVPPAEPPEAPRAPAPAAATPVSQPAPVASASEGAEIAVKRPRGRPRRSPREVMDALSTEPGDTSGL